MPEQILLGPSLLLEFDGGQVAGLARVGSPVPGEAAVGRAVHDRRASLPAPRSQGTRIGRSPVRRDLAARPEHLRPLFPLPTLVAPGATPGGSPWFDFLAGQASGRQPDHPDLDHGLDMRGLAVVITRQPSAPRQVPSAVWSAHHW